MATPVITSALIMLFIDRNYGGSFFDPRNGGDPILYQNIFWFYSHPAVYVMILPAMGMISEILPVFSRKPLFGYKAFVFATAAIGALGFSVWAHHMFTTGAVYLPFFSLMTFLIAIPTGVKMFNWIFTMWRGKLTFSTPMIFAVGFLSMFLLGGINGAFSASVPVDFALHDTYFVVAHIHYVLFGGSVFGIMAGFYYWFPKMTGRMLNETLGKVQFVLMFIGFNMTFFPMHELGLAGMPRRIADYSATAGWNDLNLVATIGGFLIAASMLPFLWNIFMSLRSGPAGGRRPVGSQHPRVGDELAAAALQLRPTARDPLRATPVRPPARAGGGPLSADATMTTDSQSLTTAPVQHDPLENYGHDRRGGISNPILGMLLFITSEVMFFAGLFAAYFNTRASARRLAAGRVRRHAQGLAVAGPAGHDPADHQLVHLPDRGLVDPQGRPGPVHPGDGHHGRPGHHLPRDAGDGLLPARPRDAAADPVVGDVRDDVLHADRLPRRPRLRWRDHAQRGPVPRHVGPVLGEAPRCGRGGVAVLALRRRRLDPAVHAAVHRPGQGLREAGCISSNTRATRPCWA